MDKVEKTVDAMCDLVREMSRADRDAADNGHPVETVRVVLNLSKASVVFAAWLVMTQRARSGGEHTVAPIPNLEAESIMNSLRPLARSWFVGTIDDTLNTEWENLHHGEHHFLSPPAKRQPEIDDGLPF